MFMRSVDIEEVADEDEYGGGPRLESNVEGFAEWAARYQEV